MFKKIVAMMVMVAFISAPVCSVYAAEYPSSLSGTQANDTVISPKFVGVNRVTASLSISSSGTAKGMINVFPKSSSSIDYILTTASLVNSSGSKVKTWTNIKSTINSNGYFILDKSYTLQSRGQYKLTYTVNCYKNGAVTDTASSETGYQTY